MSDIKFDNSVEEWIRRKLGKPTVKIDSLTKEQISDSMEEALEWANYYHNAKNVPVDYATVWAKNVALSLCKKQIGMNGLFYKNQNLPGGVKTNYPAYIKLGDSEMKQLTKDIRKVGRK